MSTGNRSEHGSALPDEVLVAQLLRGEEAAFRAVLRRHHARLTGLARALTGNDATADEVVQDTWLAVIEGLGGLADPAAFKPWLYAILANTARKRAARDRRVVLVPGPGAGEDPAPAVDPARFTARGFWRDPPAPWDGIDAERIVAGRELVAHLSRALDALPAPQRAVVLLRDVEGLDGADTCAILGIAPGHARVLLHRGRARLRAALAGLVEAPGRDGGGGGGSGGGGRPR
ncbi:MAG: RNA polymerase sigma factor [Thermohalobaculum sp.]|nr:RNA polymerase sigma factor [Thermohalobaculum sp.]